MPQTRSQRLKLTTPEANSPKPKRKVVRRAAKSVSGSSKGPVLGSSKDPKKKRGTGASKKYIPKTRWIKFNNEREEYRRAPRTKGVSQMSEKELKVHKAQLRINRMKQRLYREEFTSKKSDYAKAKYRALPCTLMEGGSKCSRKNVEFKPVDEGRSEQDKKRCRMVLKEKLRRRRVRRNSLRPVGKQQPKATKEYQHAYDKYKIDKNRHPLSREEHLEFRRRFRENIEENFNDVQDEKLRAEIEQHAAQAALHRAASRKKPKATGPAKPAKKKATQSAKPAKKKAKKPAKPAKPAKKKSTGPAQSASTRPSRAKKRPDRFQSS